MRLHYRGVVRFKMATSRTPVVLMDSKERTGRRRRRSLHLKEKNKQFEFRASQKDQPTLEKEREKAPPVLEPPQKRDHLDEYANSNQSSLDDSSLGLEITWDHNTPCHNTEYSGKRIDELLLAFPSVVSPVSKGSHMSLTSMEQRGPVYHNYRRRDMDHNSLERLKCLANMLQKQQHGTASCQSLEETSEEHMVSKNKENMRTSTSSCSSPFHDSFLDNASILDQVFTDNWDEDEVSPCSKESPIIFRPRSRTMSQQTLASSAPSATPTSLPPVNLFRKPVCDSTTATPHVHKLAIVSDTPMSGSASSTGVITGVKGGISDIDDISDTDDDISDDDQFWSQVANTKEELLLKNNNEDMLNSEIDQLFQVDSIAPSTGHNSSQTTNDRPDTRERPFKDLKFSRSNSEPVQLPGSAKKSLCSQEDIEKKKQLAKRKLQMRMKSN